MNQCMQSEEKLQWRPELKLQGLLSRNLIGTQILLAVLLDNAINTLEKSRDTFLDSYAGEHAFVDCLFGESSLRFHGFQVT